MRRTRRGVKRRGGAGAGGGGEVGEVSGAGVSEGGGGVAERGFGFLVCCFLWVFGWVGGGLGM